MFIDKFIDRNAAMDKMTEMVTNALAQTKLNELLHKEEPKPQKKTHPALIALAVVGAVASVAAIAYCVYRFMYPDYLEDFEDDEFEDEEEEE